MGSFNTNVVVLGGNLATDPESKDLPQGETLTRFRLAVGNGDRTVFVPVSIFGKQAEACAEYLAKGNPVVVEGKLQQSQWETEEGDKRTSFSVKAHRVAFGPRPHPVEEDED